MIIEIAKDLYPKTVVLKSAYMFTDRAFIYISQTSNNYVIDIEAKDGKVEIEQEFKNELLSQALRYDVVNKTKIVRELIISRALASTVIDDDNSIIEYKDNPVDDEILKDWFDSNDED